MSNTTFSLWIINKAGGQKTYAEGLLPQLTSNDYLVLAGTFHGIHAITSKLSPVHPSGGGVETVEADIQNELLPDSHRYQVRPLHLALSPVPTKTTSRIYGVYADLLKDPFYTVENPIRNETFDKRCLAICTNV
ncbi:hypothetical protein PSTT_12889 [Puccinia striiformis]|uniref:Trafficking protein particle complex subunit n=1 Tax=Puccinia striiformis TaxID=27350 RepID=A0A2S4UU52_9BASI|nr:hypothetical protein PSTT_12889 [Puccinia striiformis]